MNDDIFASVREEILKEDAKALPWVPKELEHTWEFQAGVAGAITGLLAGLSFGAHMGLAGPWGAIAGTVPCAVVGCIMGYFAGAKAGSKVSRNSPLDFGVGAGKTSPSLPSAGAPMLTVGVCSNCGARKSVWWDSSRNVCSQCDETDTGL